MGLWARLNCAVGACRRTCRRPVSRPGASPLNHSSKDDCGGDVACGDGGSAAALRCRPVRAAPPRSPESPRTPGTWPCGRRTAAARATAGRKSGTRTRCSPSRPKKKSVRRRTVNCSCRSSKQQSGIADDSAGVVGDGGAGLVAHANAPAQQIQLAKRLHDDDRGPHAAHADVMTSYHRIVNGGGVKGFDGLKGDFVQAAVLVVRGVMVHVAGNHQQRPRLERPQHLGQPGRQDGGNVPSRPLPR